MHRLVRTCALSLALVLATVGLAAPASASDYSVSISTVPLAVGYASCEEDVPFPYSVNPPAEHESWYIELEITKPDGTSSLGVNIGDDAPLVGVGYWDLCPQNAMTGTHSVTGAYYVEMPDGPILSKWIKTPIEPFTFDVRFATLRANASPSDKTPSRGEHVKVTVQVTDERPGGGFFGTYAADVQLQRLQGKRWIGVKGATGDTSTSGREVLTFKYTWRGKNKFRVRAKDFDLGTVDSRAFVLRTSR